MSDITFLFIAVLSLLSGFAFTSIVTDFLYREVKEISRFSKIVFIMLTGVISFNVTFIVLIFLHKTAILIINIKA